MTRLPTYKYLAGVGGGAGVRERTIYFHFARTKVLADGPLARGELERQSAAAQSGSVQQHHCMNDSALERRRETHFTASFEPCERFVRRSWIYKKKTKNKQIGSLQRDMSP